MNKVSIAPESIETLDAAKLLADLSLALETITGCSGAASFDKAEMLNPRACFAVARDEDGVAVGCGAIRPIDEKTAEMKRVYARTTHAGVGTLLVQYLESKAKQFYFERIILETRIVNRKAVQFYLKNGYHVIPNYGKYSGRVEAVCFEKRLV